MTSNCVFGITVPSPQLVVVSLIGTFNLDSSNGDETNTLLGTRTRRTKDWTRLDRSSIISSDLFEFKYVTSIKASLSRLFATRTNGLDGIESSISLRCTMAWPLRPVDTGICNPHPSLTQPAPSGPVSPARSSSHRHIALMPRQGPAPERLSS